MRLTRRTYILLFVGLIVLTGVVLAYSGTWISKTMTMHLFHWAAGEHDIAVVDIEVSTTVVGQNYSTSINVTVENQGDFVEDFKVTTYYSTTHPIATKDVHLASGDSNTITFTWNTTCVAFGNYTISATATPVTDETDLTDNTLADSWVVVTIPGDVDGDFKVDHEDLLLLASAYGSKLGDSDYIAETDINVDGRVDHDDLLILASNYGKKA